jgi:hypothetical protein
MRVQRQVVLGARLASHDRPVGRELLVTAESVKPRVADREKGLPFFPDKVSSAEYRQRRYSTPNRTLENEVNCQIGLQQTDITGSRQMQPQRLAFLDRDNLFGSQVEL